MISFISSKLFSIGILLCSPDVPIKLHPCIRLMNGMLLPRTDLSTCLVNSVFCYCIFFFRYPWYPVTAFSHWCPIIFTISSEVLFLLPSNVLLHFLKLSVFHFWFVQFLWLIFPSHYSTFFLSGWFKNSFN